MSNKRDPNNLREKVRRFLEIEGKDAIATDAEMTEFVLDNCEIYFREDSRFFCQTDLARDNYPQYFEVMSGRFEKEFAPFSDDRFKEAMKSAAIDMRFDFGHTTPCWEDVISLGFSGLRARAARYAKENTDPEKERFYSSVLKVYDASERFIVRLINKARSEGREEIAASLENLLVSPPKTMFEGFQMLLLFHFLQHFGENTWIRTFGRVDQLLYPFFKNTPVEEARSLVRDFIAEINGHGMSENQPFALGGTDDAGNDLINELSYIFIEEYKKQKPPFVKIHILCSNDTPKSFLKSALDGVRHGANSVCFFGDAVLKKTLLKLGVSEADANRYHVDGCYECGGYGETTCPVTGRVSIAKAVELALNGGTDMLLGYKTGLSPKKTPESFEEFYSEFLRQLSHIADTVKIYAAKMESLYPRIHAGLIYSSSYPEYIANGKDVFASFGAKYNNSSICGVGLGTAVDSLLAVKKLVYDDETLSYGELQSLMRSNWQGAERLRLTVKNKFPKYGMGDKTADALAADLVERLAEMINKAPNAKGGVYRLGLHSITARWALGAALGATPDGRLAGETVSLNSGASFGADREGITAHILSVTEIDATNSPNSVTLDIDMHSSAVKGESGLEAMYASLITYLKRGGFSIHYNVLDGRVLRDAQKNPENYPNLQVRVCGWNMLFNNLPKYQQDEYIVRSERW